LGLVHFNIRERRRSLNGPEQCKNYIAIRVILTLSNGNEKSEKTAKKALRAFLFEKIKSKISSEINLAWHKPCGVYCGARETVGGSSVSVVAGVRTVTTKMNGRDTLPRCRARSLFQASISDLGSGKTKDATDHFVFIPSFHDRPL
jgi:hypothetical protein